MAELNVAEDSWDRARIKKSPLANEYYKSFLALGKKLGNLRKHRSLVEGQATWNL